VTSGFSFYDNPRNVATPNAESGKRMRVVRVNKPRFAALVSYSSLILYPLSISSIRRLPFTDDVRYLEGVNYKKSSFIIY